jgi:phage tail sheath gpL-like
MTVNTPISRFENLPATLPTTLAQEKLLFICQKTAAGTAVEGELYTQLETDLDYEDLAGKDSIGAAMIRAAQKKVENSERKPQFDAIFFDDAGGSVAAIGNIIFVNDPTSATADRTIYVTVGDEDPHEYKFNTAGDVAFTAKNKGEEGNKLTLQVKGYVPGITISITQPTGGSGTPDISGVSTTIQNLRYQTVTMPETYDFDSFADFLDTRWPPSPTGIIKDGALIVCLTDTLANLKTSTDAANQKVVGLFPNKPASLDPSGHSDLVIKGAAHPQMNYVIAAKIAAIRALRLTSDADITEYTNAVLTSRDNTGGIHISTLPYHNIPLTDVPLADQRNVWTEEETLELLDAGYAIFGNNVENTAVLIGDVVTRYEKNDEGKDDPSYKYLNYLDQASIVREYFTVNLKSTYKNYRLTSGVVVPDENMADQGEIKAECIKLYGDLADIGVMVKGQAAKQLFIDSLVIIEFNEALGKVTLKFKNPIVTQVREIVGDIQLTFTT